MASYVRLVTDLHMMSSSQIVPPAKAKPVGELDSVIPRVFSTGFQMRGSDQVVVTVEGENMWFVTDVRIEGVTKRLVVESSEADMRSVSMVLNTVDEIKDGGKETRKVTVQSHFSGCTEDVTKATTKVMAAVQILV